MSWRATRRQFLQTTTALGLADLSVFRGLAADAPTPAAIDFGADVKPIVRLIEETPRNQCVPVLVEQLRRGLSYRRFLAGVFLAAIRKGDSHHSVYLVHSAHQVSLDLRPEERLLPLFWAVDHYKWQQEAYPTPPLPPLTGALPAAEKAAAEFHAAMQAAQSDRAERALVAVARTQGARQASELLWPYGCRDLSFIGHRAIAVSSCARALDTIGWQHSEAVLRFVVRDLHLRGGGVDAYYRANSARADQCLAGLPAQWATGQTDPGAVRELFTLLRAGKSEPACELAGKQLTDGVGAQAIWDVVHVAAAEVLLLHNADTGMAGRPLHINTAVNAMHHAFHAALTPRARLLNLLQAVAWVGDFTRVHLGNRLNDDKMTDLAGAPLPATAAEAVNEIFAQLTPRTYSPGKTGGGHLFVKRAARGEAIRKVFALTTQHPESAGLYQQAARSWLAVKATVEAHEYKLPAALFEDYALVSPAWRSRLLAASAHWLHGPQSADSAVLQQARAELKKLG